MLVNPQGPQMATAIIAGAGVGGLATGVALKRAGWTVKVCERYEGLRTAGTGLTLWPNGVRVIEELGLGGSLRAISERLRTYLTLSEDGEIVTRNDLDALADRFGAHMVGVHRPSLNAMLADQLGESELEFLRQVMEFKEEAEAIRVTFGDGSEMVGDCLLGADGIHSSVRDRLWGDVEICYTGLVRWRGVFQLNEVDVDPAVLVNVYGNRGHFGWLAIGHGAAYWYATGRELDDRKTFEAYFGAMTRTPVPSILEATPDSTWIRNRLLVPPKPLKKWGMGRVTLLGDAAHPMMPGKAQGACQALEDAAALERYLRECTHIVDCLRAYEAERLPRANRVVEASSHAFEFARDISEGEREWGSSLRDPASLVETYHQDVEGPLASPSNGPRPALAWKERANDR